MSDPTGTRRCHLHATRHALSVVRPRRSITIRARCYSRPVSPSGEPKDLSDSQILRLHDPRCASDDVVEARERDRESRVSPFPPSPLNVFVRAWTQGKVSSETARPRRIRSASADCQLRSDLGEPTFSHFVSSVRRR